MKYNTGLIYLVLALTLSAVNADYTISTTCLPQTCTYNGTPCNNCVYFNGGPFNGDPICFDDNPNDVSAICLKSLTFLCSSPQCSNQLAFTGSLNGETFTGCANDNNTEWNCPLNSESCSFGLEQILNLFYFGTTVGKSTSYDWTIPCSSGLSGGAIAGIVIGCVVFVALVIVGIVWYRRRSASGGSYPQDSSRQVQFINTSGPNTSRV